MENYYPQLLPLTNIYVHLQRLAFNWKLISTFFVDISGVGFQNIRNLGGVYCFLYIQEALAEQALAIKTARTNLFMN